MQILQHSHTHTQCTYYCIWYAFISLVFAATQIIVHEYGGKKPNTELDHMAINSEAQRHVV